MCSISGAIALELDTTVSPRLINGIFEASLERGRDAVGRYDGGNITRVLGRAPLLPVGNDSTIVMQSNRAEPTTEWLPDVTELDLQPYSHERTEEPHARYGDLIWVHNGTIANDKQLAQTLGLSAPRIDSQIIGAVLDDSEPLGVDTIVEKLGALIGSYAIAAYDEYDSVLYLASNYKPIYTALYGGVLYWASLPHHLPGYGAPSSTVQKLKPYTVMAIRAATSTTPSMYTFMDIPCGDGNTDVLVVASGGMDSTVVAAQMASEGRNITLLHVEYGARAQGPERAAVEALARFFGCELIVVETDLFKSTIKASRLTETHTEIAEGEAGAELAIEWVPARNLILASIAVGIAEARNIGTIALGNNLEESGAYPDNEQEFIHRLNDVLPNAVNAGRRVRFVQPVGNLMKHEIVAAGLAHKAPLDITWSCYNKGPVQCGHCGPCYMRRTAFRMNGVEDPIEYEEPLA